MGLSNRFESRIMYHATSMGGPDSAAHTADHRRLIKDLDLLREKTMEQRKEYIPTIRVHLWNLSVSAGEAGLRIDHMSIATRMINQYLGENEKITIESF